MPRGHSKQELLQAQARANHRQGCYYEAELDLAADPDAVVRKFFPRADGKNALRDPCGGTVFHWCMLLGSGPLGSRSEEHRQIAEHIIAHCCVEILNLQYNRCGSCLMTECPTSGRWMKSREAIEPPYDYLWYDGETALHIAVAKGDEDLVQALADRVVDSEKRAYGSFFAPADDAPCYYGEYALSFAASCGLDDIVRIIMDRYPSAIRLNDTFGNTAFHMAIQHRRLSTYKLLVELSGMSFTEVSRIHGAMGFTPLAMAACLAPFDDFEGIFFEHNQTQNQSIFQTVMDMSRDVAWEFSNVVAHSYSLEQIDTLRIETREKKQVRKPCQSEPFDAVKSDAAPESARVPEASKKTREKRSARRLRSKGDDSVAIDAEPDNDAPGEEVSPRRAARQVRHKPPLLCDHPVRCADKVSENTEFHSVLSLVLNYNLYHMMDEGIIEELLAAKWHVIHPVYYVCMLYQFVYVCTISLFTLLMHPNVYDQGYETEQYVLRWLTVFLAWGGLVPFAFDVLAGLRYRKAMRQLRRSKVKRRGRPKALPWEEWVRYQGCEFMAIPEVPSMWYYNRLEAFPLSGFDIFTLLNFALLIIYLVLDAVDDFEVPTNGTTANITTAGHATASDVPPPDTPAFVMVLGFSTMFAWLSTLTFAPIHVRLGMVVTMMARALYRDVLPFMTIFMILLGASSMAIYCVTHEGYTIFLVADTMKDTFLPTIESNMRLKNPGPGEDGPQGARGPSPGAHSVLAYFTVLVFVLIWAVLMMNLFIASLTSTYEEVKARAQLEWKLQWGRDILLLERRLCLFASYRERLLINHGNSDQHTHLSITRKDKSRKKASAANTSTRVLIHTTSPASAGLGTPRQDDLFCKSFPSMSFSNSNNRRATLAGTPLTAGGGTHFLREESTRSGLHEAPSSALNSGSFIVPRGRFADLPPAANPLRDLRQMSSGSCGRMPTEQFHDKPIR